MSSIKNVNLAHDALSDVLEDSDSSPREIRQAATSLCLALNAHNAAQPAPTPKSRITQLETALTRLLNCPDLGLDELEDETREAIEQAQDVLDAEDEE